MDDHATTSPAGPGTKPVVTLEASSVTWETYQYELTQFDTISAGSYDGATRTRRTFDTWVLENEYLRVTLLPEFGGRILSIIYKPTGHEQLYQNPVGVPYQIDTGVFYYNWLMVYGGIFPTFPEPEHGKTWFMPWSFEVIEESDAAVTVAMEFVDDQDHPLAPGQYARDATGLRVTFLVTLRAGRTALDTVVVVENPNDAPVEFEYWSNATVAPGSDPADPRVTAAAEIVAPIEFIKIPSYWESIAAAEKATGLNEIYRFDSLRHFGNWPDRGIAYAFPDMSRANFWGVINHDNREGLFRIADNTVTPGLKIWTWGYPQTVDLDPDTGPFEPRPYIELWAGLTREFFQQTEIAANFRQPIMETYSPSVGLADVTHASEDFLANMTVDAQGAIRCEVFGFQPETSVSAVLLLDGVVIHEETLTLDPRSGNVIVSTLPEQDSQGVLTLSITDAAGSKALEAALDLANP